MNNTTVNTESVTLYNELYTEFSKPVESELALMTMIQTYNKRAAVEELSLDQREKLKALVVVGGASVDALRRDKHIAEMIPDDASKDGAMWRKLLATVKYRGIRVKAVAQTKADKEACKPYMLETQETDREFKFADFARVFNDVRKHELWTIPEGGMKFEQAFSKFVSNAAYVTHMRANSTSSNAENSNDGARFIADHKPDDITIGEKSFKGGSMNCCRALANYLVSCLLPEDFKNANDDKFIVRGGDIKAVGNKVLTHKGSGNVFHTNYDYDALLMMLRGAFNLYNYELKF